MSHTETSTTTLTKPDGLVLAAQTFIAQQNIEPETVMAKLTEAYRIHYLTQGLADDEKLKKRIDLNLRLYQSMLYAGAQGLMSWGMFTFLMENALGVTLRSLEIVGVTTTPPDKKTHHTIAVQL